MSAEPNEARRALAIIDMEHDDATGLARAALGELKVREIEAEASVLDNTEAAIAELGQVPIA